MWKNKNIILIFIGEFIAGIGLWLGIIGNLEFMQKHIPSDFVKSLILFSGLLAGVIVSPIAGRWIDTYNKKHILLYAGIGRVGSVLFMLFALKYESIFLMICFMISIQIAAAFYFPTLQAIIPLAVTDEKQLMTVNGMHMNISALSRIAGTAFGGALLMITSLQTLYIGAMIAYILLFFLTFFIDIKEERRETKHSKKEKQRFTDIFPIIRQLPIVYIAVVLTIVPQLFIGGFNLMVINISELQHDPSIKGWLYTIEGIGFLFGAFFIKYAAHEKAYIKWMYALTCFIAFAQLSLHFAHIKWVSLASFGLFGISVGCFFPMIATIFQTNVPKLYHGRFFSFKNMFDRVTFQIVLLASGFLLDTIGLENMVVLFGSLSLLLMTYTMFRKKEELKSEGA
ncbi:MFS transporter [Anoxybacillus sp. MB8]|uniref:MFS transporter n=1 Tax=Anoxybacillus sp. MB8 TaxID=2496850 RepID=UPI0013D037E9|nr:MFS transporter [Anoxybacillus sp. MB8]